MAERYRTFSALPGYNEQTPEELDRLPDLFDDSGNPIAPPINPYPSLTNPQVIGSDSGILSKTEPPVPIVGDSIAATDPGTSVPTTGSPLLQQIASPPDIGTNFGFKLANLALGQIPVIGPLLQQGHLETKQQENLTQQLQGLQASAASLPPEYQKILAGMVQQGQGAKALTEFPDLAAKASAAQLKKTENTALQSALKFRIARIQDPIVRESFTALALTDPEKAHSQVGAYENARIAEGFRGRAEDRTMLQSEIAANEDWIKNTKDDPLAKKALDIRDRLVSGKFSLKDLELGSAAFAKRFGLDAKKDVLVKNQVEAFIEEQRKGGFWGIGGNLPSNDPKVLLQGIENKFADPEALTAQERINKLKQELQDQANAKRSLLTQKRPAKAPTAKAGEIERKTQDGRIAIYDEKTKTFLRYK